MSIATVMAVRDYRRLLRKILRALDGNCIECATPVYEHHERDLDACVQRSSYRDAAEIARRVLPAPIAEPMPTKRAPAQKRRAA